MKLPVKRLIWVTGVLILMVLLGTLAVTKLTAHGGDSNLIHSCVNNGSGEIKIVGKDESCKNNWTALDWNIKGESGPPGMPASTRVVTESVTVPGDFSSVNSPFSLTVVCGNNEWLTGGGFAQTTVSAGAFLTVLDSTPVTVGSGLANGWTTRVQNRINVDQVLKVFAVCAAATP